VTSATASRRPRQRSGRRFDAVSSASRSAGNIRSVGSSSTSAGRHVHCLVAPSACAEANLVIEIDGDSHVPPDQASYDTARSQWLEERGYRVFRFSAQQVEDDLPEVVSPTLHFILPAQAAGQGAERGEAERSRRIGMLPEDHRDLVREGDTGSV